VPILICAEIRKKASECRERKILKNVKKALEAGRSS
jgi:hypothetical protein